MALFFRMNSRTNSMPVQKSDSDACSVKKPASTACGIKKPAAKKEKPRKWADVSKEVVALRAKGLSVPAIAQELKISYALVNQHCLRSYKMTTRAEEVFNRQEAIRLGLA